MQFDSPVALPYHTYNSLFLSLPFRGIEETGTHLALFARVCAAGFEAGKSPRAIIEGFWKEYAEKYSDAERIGLLFHFVQYLERQVVLFDSVEDALFEKTHELNGAGSVNHLLLRLSQNADRKKLLEKLAGFQLRLVLTAHPTQFYPGKVLGIINDLGQVIRENDLSQIRLLLMQLGKTTFLNKEKPTPYDEAVSLGWYLENVFYSTLPEILFHLLKNLGQDVTRFENPQLLALGFWPGGDRDGNPFVTADITRAVASRLRGAILRRYYYDLRNLRRRLTFRGTEDWIIAAEQKINNTLYHPDEDAYENCQQLLNDLMQARAVLINDHDGLFLDDLDLLILKIRVFGFYFASIDVRQDSRKHDAVWEAILQNWSEKNPGFNFREFQKADENTRINQLLTTPFRLDENDYADAFVKETIRSFRAIATIQAQNGELGCHRYIISNCQSAIHVAAVLALARLTIANPPSRDVESQTPNGKTAAESAGPGLEQTMVNLDIVPLFETVEDLATAAAVMEKLYTNPIYWQHLSIRNNRQTIMLGFSDGTKDGGYLRANWSIYQAKEALTRVSRKYGVTVIFFDGRGGPPGRGGGNNANYYAAQGADIENHEIQVTIQGQTISSTYGTIPSARFNIERLLSSGLENFLFETHARELSDADKALLDELAEASYQAYLQLKNHPDFVPYLEQITPLKWYGDTNIASRPTKRGTAAALKFEDLRAIPFVGAWAQMKQNVPGYFGFGAAIAGMREAGRLEALQDLYQRSLFFQTLVENSMQSLCKSNFNVTQYLSEHPKFKDLWQLLFNEYETAVRGLLDLSGQPDILANNPASKASIAMRETIIQPLIAIQQYALQQLQSEGLEPEQEAVFRKLVLRAMFGIINAARNAA